MFLLVLLITNTFGQGTVYFRYLNDTLTNTSCSTTSDCYSIICHASNHNDGNLESVNYLFNKTWDVVEYTYNEQ